MSSRYPKGYFLKFLGLEQPRSKFSYRRSSGTPIFWERTAKKTYICAICGKEIQKGERYIGCRKLKPGYPGPYGWKGTYQIFRFHIKCLLEIEEKETRKEIDNLRFDVRRLQAEITKLEEKISEIEKRIKIHKNKEDIETFCPEVEKIEVGILNLQQQISLETDKVNALCTEIKDLEKGLKKAEMELKTSPIWRKPGKWFFYQIIRLFNNRKISSSKSKIRNIVDEKILSYEKQIISLRHAAISHLEKKIKIYKNQILEWQEQIADLEVKIERFKERFKDIQKMRKEILTLGVPPYKKHRSPKQLYLRRWRLPDEV